MVKCMAIASDKIRIPHRWLYTFHDYFRERSGPFLCPRCFRMLFPLFAIQVICKVVRHLWCGWPKPSTQNCVLSSREITQNDIGQCLPTYTRKPHPSFLGTRLTQLTFTPPFSPVHLQEKSKCKSLYETLPSGTETTTPQPGVVFQQSAIGSTFLEGID